MADPALHPVESEIRHDLGIALDAQMDSLAQQGFSGAVLVAVDGEIVLRNGYGLADHEQRFSVKPSTVFHIGSVTKQFTGAAILKLEEQGKLAVNDRISRFFPDVSADKAGITLHHLLTHTSGFRGSVVPCSQRQAGEIDREEFVSRALDSELLFRPGQYHRYSNVGYELLGAIIEIASDVDYETYLKNNLLNPAGMFDTGHSLETWPETDRIAVGYRANGERWGTYHELFWGSYGPLWCNRASGALLSTVDDLYLWHEALSRGRILDPTQVNRLFTPYVPESEAATSFYGYGWAIFTTSRETRMVGHNGSLNNILEADVRSYVDEGVVVVVVGNSGEFRATRAVRELPPIIFDR